MDRSVDPFASLRARAKSSQANLVKANLILEAVTQVIRSTRGDELTPTAYYGALMASMESQGSKLAADGDAIPVLYLLSLAMPHVSSAVLRSTFTPASALFSAVLSVDRLRNDAPAMRSILTCVGALLMAQEPAAETWARPEVLKLFNTVLELGLEVRPKVRKAAQRVVTDLLRAHSSVGATGLAGKVTKFCSRVLSTCSGGSSMRRAELEAATKQAQQLLALMRSCLPVLPEASVAKLCGALLRLCDGGKPSSAILAYRFIAELAKRAQSPLSRTFLVDFVGQMMETAPDTADYVAAAEFPYAIAACMKRLHMLEAGAADSDDETSTSTALTSPGTAAVLPGVVLHLVGYMESDRPAVFRSAATSLATVLYYCIDGSIVRQGMRQAAAGTAATAASRSLSIAARVCAALESVLAFRCQPAWRVAVPVLSVAFARMGPASHVLLRSLVIKLMIARVPIAKAAAIGAAAADVEDDRSLRKLIKEDKVERSTAASAEIRRSMERVLGVAIASMGPARFLEIVPLATPVDGSADMTASGGVHVDKEFLLPLIKTYTRYTRASLAFFTTHLLEAARKCLAACGAAQQAGDVAAAKVQERRLLQLWACFPSFCVAPVDVAAAYTPALGKTLVQAINDARFHRLKTSVCAGLLSLLRRNRAVVRRADGFEDDRWDGESTVGGSEFASTFHESRTGSHRSSRSFASRRSARSAATSISKPVFNESELDVEVLAVVMGPAASGAELPEIPEVEARRNVEAMKALAPKFIASLFQAYEATTTASSAHARAILSTVTAYCALADAKLLNHFFDRLHTLLVKALAQASETMQVMHDARQAAIAAAKAKTAGAGAGAGAGSAEAGEPVARGKGGATHKQQATLERAAALMSLSLSLVPSLDTEKVSKLYKVLRPAIMDDTLGSVQKRAYKVLHSVCQHHAGFVLHKERLADVITLLVDSLPTCSASSKADRLGCLGHIVRALDQNTAGHVKLVSSLLGEVMLCTKEANTRARTAAFDLLVAMGHWMFAGGEGPGLAPGAVVTQTDPTLTLFFRGVLGGLGGATPDMRSASVIVLARLVHEFRESNLVLDMVPKLLGTVLMLLRERNHQVIKSVIAFCKSAIACMPPAQFGEKVEVMIKALLTMPKDMKHHFKGKTRTVLEKLVRKYGLDVVAAAVPEADAKLLTHIRKQGARRERKRAAKRAAAGETKDEDGDVGMGGAGAEGSDMDSDSESDSESDFDEPLDPESADITTRRQLGKAKGAAAWIVDGNGAGNVDPVDFLNPAASAVVGTNPAMLSRAMKRISSHHAADAKLKTGDDGRLDVGALEQEARSKPRRRRGGDEEDEADGRKGRGNKRGRPRPQDRKRSRPRDQGDAGTGAGAGAGAGSGMHRSNVKQALAATGWGASRRAVTRRPDPSSGSAYKSKRAGGDVMRKGMKLEPFAYIPLDPKAMSGGGRERAVSRYAGVVANNSNKGVQSASHGHGKRRRRR